MPKTFGEPCVLNALLANLTGTDEQKIELADHLAAGATFVNVNSSTKVAKRFLESFKIIDVVVYVVTVMYAALAFAVVFTLSNTNISERARACHDQGARLQAWRGASLYQQGDDRTHAHRHRGGLAAWLRDYGFLT